MIPIIKMPPYEFANDDNTFGSLFSYAVVKRGFVLNSDVFVESSTKFLYIFKRQIRNWPPEEHVSLASGNFRLDSEIGKDDKPSGVPKCRSIAVSPAIAGRRSR